MSEKQAWERILSVLHGKRMEFPTTPMNRREPVWFSAALANGDVVIGPAAENNPSSRISGVRRITFQEFALVYPIYQRRLSGEQVSYDAARATMNQVYIYSLIHHTNS